MTRGKEEERERERKGGGGKGEGKGGKRRWGDESNSAAASPFARA
jgi:hypothetical protein